ncbi:MAG TPA: folate-binding protein [Terriglobales bacterium]
MQLAAHDLAAQNDDKPAPVNASDLPAEFHALVSGCGIYASARARIVMTGSDRSRWLNGMVTNNIRDLEPGHGVYAFLLNPQGRIQGDLFAFNDGERLIVQTERGQAEKILQIFDRYIIMDDVEIDNQSDKFAVIGIAGPECDKALAAVGLDGQKLRPLQFAAVTWNGHQVTLVRGDNPCVPNYELWLQTENAEAARTALLKAGAREVHEHALETFRIACGIPRFGRDIRDRDLPQETAQEHALNFSKGCYVGQEIVERIRSRGAVHRTLVGFEFAGSAPPIGAKVQHEGKDVGEITSVATVPTKTGDRVLALGYLRKEFMVGKELRAGEASVSAESLPFRGIFSD